MLDDKYRIERLLAHGGMGAVYLGTHTKLRKRVAIKLLNPELSTPAMVERFHREAITASQIGHEGIAQCTDLGTSQDGEPFLVMEYLEGESLAARLKASGPMAIEVACELACSILSPLAAAHAAGIVHRDLKPDNVFLVRQSRGEMVKLLDFGISRTQGLDGEFRLTTTGLVLGTPYYMSPEQARGQSEVSPAADIYAFGVMLYEMLVGAVPIHGDNYNQLMYRVMTGEYVPPRQRRADLPDILDRIIVHAMALEPENRPQSANELEMQLLAFCRPTFREHTIDKISSSGLPQAPVPTPSFRGPAPSGIDPTVAMPTPAPAMARKRSLVPYIVAGLLIAIGVVAIVVFTTHDAPKPPAIAAPTTPTPPPTSTPPVVAPVVTTATIDAAPAAPATITLRFAVDPKSAAVTVDGKPVADNELVIAKDDAPHQLHITAPGFAPHDETIHFDESQRVSVELKKAAAVAHPGHKDPKSGDDRIDTQSPY
jgi:serine/threonine-protein kinase